MVNKGLSNCLRSQVMPQEAKIYNYKFPVLGCAEGFEELKGSGHSVLQHF